MPLPRCLVTTLLSGAVLIVITTGCVKQRLYRDTWISASLQAEPITQQTAAGIAVATHQPQPQRDVKSHLDYLRHRSTRPQYIVRIRWLRHPSTGLARAAVVLWRASCGA